jgi:hypothetical protein
MYIRLALSLISFAWLRGNGEYNQYRSSNGQQRYTQHCTSYTSIPLHSEGEAIIKDLQKIENMESRHTHRHTRRSIQWATIIFFKGLGKYSKYENCNCGIALKSSSDFIKDLGGYIDWDISCQSIWLNEFVTLMKPTLILIFFEQE